MQQGGVDAFNARVQLLQEDVAVFIFLFFEDAAGQKRDDGQRNKQGRSSPKSLAPMISMRKKALYYSG